MVLKCTGIKLKYQLIEVDKIIQNEHEGSGVKFVCCGFAGKKW